MSKKASASTFRPELFRAALVLGLSGSLGLIVNTFSAHSMPIFTNEPPEVPDKSIANAFGNASKKISDKTIEDAPRVAIERPVIERPVIERPIEKPEVRHNEDGADDAVGRVFEKPQEAPPVRVIERPIEAPPPRVIERQIEAPPSRVIERQIEAPPARVIERPVEVPQARVERPVIVPPPPAPRVIDRPIERVPARPPIPRVVDLTPGRITLGDLGRSLKDPNQVVRILDARGEAAFDVGHIPNSIHVPIEMIQNSRQSVDALLQGATLIAVYCDSDACAKAEHEAEALTKLGYKNVRTIKGGWEGYKHSGYPVEETRR